MAKDKGLKKTAELLAELERLQAVLASAKESDARLQASIAERKAEAEVRYSGLFGITWKWGDPSPMAVDEFEAWVAKEKPGWVRTMYRAGDPPRTIISGPNGQAVSVPENRLSDLEQWEAEGCPSNSPATR
jgi:hypothetical protein